MFYFSIATAAMLLSMAPSAMAGTAHVVNNCGHDVYFASVAQNGASSMQLLPASGYSEGYGADGVGISIKISASATGAVTQFEYTPAGGDISYDISNIDGNPFALGGTELVPSMAGASGYPTCQTVSCPAGQTTCEAAYNQPDDVRTMVCPQASDLTMVLCPGGPSKRAEEPSLIQTLVTRMHPRQWR